MFDNADLADLYKKKYCKTTRIGVETFGTFFILNQI